MSKKLYKVASFILSLAISIIIGYAVFELSGRNVFADFVRPFLAVFAVCLASFLLIISNHKILAMIGLFIFGFIPGLIIILTFAYYQTIGSVFTGDDVVAIAQSNFEEILDFFTHYIFNVLSLLLALACVVSFSALGICLYRGFAINPQVEVLLKKRQNKTNKFKLDHPNFRLFVHGMRMRAILGALILFVTAIVLYTQLRPVSYYRLMTNDLENKIAVFNKLVSDLEASNIYKATKQEKGELYVLIIGESLSSDSMGVYNPIIKNTPFLNSLAENGKTVVFPNAYSSFVNTVPSITASFSQGNIQTGLTFPHGANLISMAKQAGFTTYWISNQVKNGNADTPIGAISNLADHSYFTTNFVFDGSYSQQPDMILLPKLKETFDSLDTTQNNLVIIHLMGSHSPYYNRYPDDYPVVKINSAAYIGGLIKQPEFSESLIRNSDYENYLTSIKYNDEVIQEISKLILDRPDFQAMVYYSDHGEALLYNSFNTKEQKPQAPAGRHNLAQFSYAMTRIPLIVSYSDKFKEQHSETVQALLKNQEQIFTNDTLFDFMLDLMNVQSDTINHQLSVASNSYSRPKPFDILLVGNKRVGLDPDYLAFKHARLPFSNTIAVKGSNSLFKANHILSKGYLNLHVNVMLKDGKLYVKVLKDFDESFIELKDYIKQLSGTPKVIVEFDDNFLSNVTTRQILETSESVGRILQELTLEEQNRIYLFAKNEVFVSYLANYLMDNPPQGFVLPDTNQNTINDDTKKQNKLKDEQKILSEVSISQQQFMKSIRYSRCPTAPHRGFPIKLGWYITEIKQLSQISTLPKMIHYIVANSDLLSSLNNDLLYCRHLIVFTPDITIQQEDFAYKMSWLRNLMHSPFLIVNYYNAFDSDY